MSKICNVLCFLSCSLILHAQDLAGDWYGKLPKDATDLKLVFHIDQKKGKLFGTMDSPNQATFGLNLNGVKQIGDSIIFDLNIFKIWFKGKLHVGDSMTGVFRQGDINLPLTLFKSVEPLPRTLSRPQEPKPPFSYKTEEVRFENAEHNVTLAGTLSLPKGKGPFPAVILVSGSGAQNRDEELFGHKPFLVISDYFTRRGIAVLRYDDRGVGKSTGNFATSTTADFAYDAASAFLYLKGHKRINKKKIGIVGHSEGGTIASMVAAADTQVRFVVMLAAPGVRIDELLLKQNKMAQELSGISKMETMISLELIRKFYDVLLNEPDLDKAKLSIESLLKRHQESMPTEIADQIKKQTPDILANFLSPWFRYFIKIDPKHFVKQITCPVLAINGSKDVQVEAIDNLMAIRRYLAESGNINAYTYIIPDLNHLMQHCETGAVSEYVLIEETFSEEILKIMADWILTLN